MFRLCDLLRRRRPESPPIPESYFRPVVVGMVLNSGGIQAEQQPDAGNCVRCGSLCPADSELCSACADAVDAVPIDPANLDADDPPAELRPCKHCGLIQPATRMLCSNCREVMP